MSYVLRFLVCLVDGFPFNPQAKHIAGHLRSESLRDWIGPDQELAAQSLHGQERPVFGHVRRSRSTCGWQS